MRFWKRGAICLLAALAAGAQQPTLSDTVVATVEGKKVTAAEMKSLMATLAPSARVNISRSPKAFLQFYYLSRYLASLAEKDQLDQQSPYKEELANARMRVLYAAEENAYSSQISVSPQDVEKLYDANKSRYPKQAEIHVITLFYSNDPPAARSKSRTESEARALITDIHQKLVNGGDFEKLQKQYSQDPTSDHGTIREEDKFNETLKKAIFTMTAGAISEPIQEPSAFYLVKVDQIGAPPLAEVRPILTEQLKQERFTAWIRGLQARFTPVLDSATGGATIDGQKLSKAEVESLIESLPQYMQAKAKHDVKNFLQEYYLVHHVASLAELAHLEEKSPYKEDFAQLRTQVLFNAALTARGNQVPVAYSEEEARYRDHPGDYGEAAVHILMVYYSAAAQPPTIAGHKLLTEAQARDMAEKIRAELHDDADFEKLEKQHPNDTKASTASLRRNSHEYSQDLKNRIFQMKAGELSEPIRETNAFYIVRLDSLATLPFDKVRDEIYRELKQERFNTWFQSVQKRFVVTIDDPGFFQQAAQ